MQRLKRKIGSGGRISYIIFCTSVALLPLGLRPLHCVRRYQYIHVSIMISEKNSKFCYLTQVKAPHFNPSQAGRYRPSRFAYLSLGVIEGWNGLPVRRQSPILVLTTRPGVELTTYWSRVQHPNLACRHGATPYYTFCRSVCPPICLLSHTGS